MEWLVILQCVLANPLDHRIYESRRLWLLLVLGIPFSEISKGRLLRERQDQQLFHPIREPIDDSRKLDSDKLLKHV